LSQLLGDFLGVIVPFSQYLDGDWLFYFTLNAWQARLVSFGSTSPEAEASL
jgi:hypothetical protein